MAKNERQPIELAGIPLTQTIRQRTSLKAPEPRPTVPRADLILRDCDPGELRAGIVADVLAALTPMLLDTGAKPKRFLGREEMAELLDWSIAKLDRRTAAKAIPSFMDEGRRMYEVEPVIDALRAGTADAERRASERQAQKQLRRTGGKK